MLREELAMDVPKPDVQDGDWPLVDKILRISESIPEEEFAVFPPDFTENLDHYLYGNPKKSNSE